MLINQSINLYVWTRTNLCLAQLNWQKNINQSIFMPKLKAIRACGQLSWINQLINQSIFMFEVILTKAYQSINQSIFMSELNHSVLGGSYFNNINPSINLYAWTHTNLCSGRAVILNQSINLYTGSYADKSISINQSIFMPELKPMHGF